MALTLLLLSKCVHTGSSPGTSADSTDLLCSYALFAQQTNNPDMEAIYLNLATFREFLNIVDSADIPEDIIPSFSCQYFLALHKDVTDDAKLHPIGIGTHVWFAEFLGAMETLAYSSEFAEFLSPFQLGIAIPGGMQLLTHCLQLLVYEHLPCSPIHTMASRALVLIDIVNMFNAASCLQCKHVPDEDNCLGKSEVDLVPIFDLLYFHDNIVWYQRYQHPDGSWDFFCHREGFTQGCLLSVIFACKVLHPVLQQLKSALDA